jgi:hypothetical protein
MEKVVRIFRSFEEADKADLEERMRMTPRERLRVMVELRDFRHPDAAQQRLVRVSRLLKRQQG